MTQTAPHAPQTPASTQPGHGALAPTLAQQARQSPAVQAAIQTIVREIGSRSAQITDVRGPLSPQHKESFEAFMARAGEARGRALMYPYVGSGIGHGPFVELMDGSVKYDMLGGIGVQFFGHSDPGMLEAQLQAATANVSMQGHLTFNEEAALFAETLVAEAAKCSNLRHAFICNSGAMANENALKVCYQKHAPASRVIAFSHCFMGRSVTMCQIGDAAANRQGIPLSTLVDYMPFYDPAAARRMSAGDVSGPTRYIDMAVWHLQQLIDRYPRQHACFIFELVQGEGGFNTALPEFHRELMKVCKASKIAVWDDEVQTFARTERMFCFDALGLGEYIDVSCVGKLTQVCAALYTKEYNPQPGLLSATFLGSTDALYTGRRVIERLRDGPYYGDNGSIRRHHQHFAAQVRALAAKHPDWFPPSHEFVDIVGGFGGMMRFTPFGGQKDPVMKLCKALFDEGVITFYCGHGPYHVRMLPPLGILDEKHWPRIFQLIESAMAKLAPTLPKAAPAPAGLPLFPP
ncbi:MAG: aminotransferase class III-fold pyridoxal phosphate-dependent enzyme [Phycisphaerales bacterium]|nr:aminotransferase class III-fold pyridoxal phosphate-dependent enzyme [Phycisphaerales bacterium]